MDMSYYIKDLLSDKLGLMVSEMVENSGEKINKTAINSYIIEAVNIYNTFILTVEVLDMNESMPYDFYMEIIRIQSNIDNQLFVDFERESVYTDNKYYLYDADVISDFYEEYYNYFNLSKDIEETFKKEKFVDLVTEVFGTEDELILFLDGENYNVSFEDSLMLIRYKNDVLTVKTLGNLGKTELVYYLKEIYNSIDLKAFLMELRRILIGESIFNQYFIWMEMLKLEPKLMAHDMVSYIHYNKFNVFTGENFGNKFLQFDLKFIDGRFYLETHHQLHLYTKISLNLNEIIEYINELLVKFTVK